MVKLASESRKNSLPNTLTSSVLKAFTDLVGETKHFWKYKRKMYDKKKNKPAANDE